MMNGLRTAILGCGNIGHLHAQNLSRLGEDVSLVAFCDRHINNAIEFQKKFAQGQAAVYEDYQDLIENAG